VATEEKKVPAPARVFVPGNVDKLRRMFEKGALPNAVALPGMAPQMTRNEG
jgi:hypothetical protein